MSEEKSIKSILATIEPAIGSLVRAGVHGCLQVAVNEADISIHGDGAASGVEIQLWMNDAEGESVTKTFPLHKVVADSLKDFYEDGTPEHTESLERIAEALEAAAATIRQRINQQSQDAGRG